MKGHTHAPAFMLKYPIPQKPWERVHLDTLELPLSETIATVIFEQIICNFSTPKTIITDNETEFHNQILQELCKLFNIKRVNVHVYKPQRNGVIERLNCKIVTCLRALINPHSITWDTWIPYVKCALNTQINTATGETSHYIIFGEDKTLMQSYLRILRNYFALPALMYMSFGLHYITLFIIDIHLICQICRIYIGVKKFFPSRMTYA